VTIRFGAQEVYPQPVDEVGLAELAEYMKGDEVRIHVSLATGDEAFTAVGGDLSDQYVRIIADYTT
jgi:N-acetylglutamate synthase/N-acetylornithine aminotransferase